MLKGVDVSDWQPGIDWAAARAAGVSFAIHKATQGTRHVSDTFAGNRRDSAAAGLGPIGLYHFAQDGDPVAQADHFCDVVGQLGPDEFAVLDIEANPDYFTLPQRSWPGFIVAFCEQVERRIGGPVVVYMSESPAKSMTVDCARWPLWVAGYQTHAPTEWEDWRVGPWASPVIWQWSSSYSVPGIGAVDQNIAPDDLRSRLGIGAPPIPDPIPPTPSPKEHDVSKVAYPLEVQSGESRTLPILAIGGGFGWARASVTFASQGVDVLRAIVGPNERPIPGLSPEGVESSRHFGGRGYVDLVAGDEWIEVELGAGGGTLDLYVEAADA